jgi:tRNA (mo5U34)-methyltransferase
VLATDSFSWGGGGWGSQAGFNLARRTLGSKVEDLRIDVMDLSPERVGSFDVVLFLGVLYHLRHPLLALERIASVSRGLLIVETVVDMLDCSRPAAAFYPDRELNNDPTNWWAPNLPALHGMLHAAGYGSVETISPPPSAGYRTARAWYRRLRGRTGAEGLAQDRAVVHARKP